MMRFAVTALLIVPLVLIGFLAANPTADVHWHVDSQHFAITTNVAVVALIVALIVTWTALSLRNPDTLFVALGFMAMAGIFAVHGLATPNVLLAGELTITGAALIVAVSAQLALFVPGVLFALRATPLPAWVAGNGILTPRRLVVLTAALLLGYGVLSMTWPAEVGRMYLAVTGASEDIYKTKGNYRDYAPWVTWFAVVVIGLLAFSAWWQTKAYLKSRLPTQGALAVAFVLLAEAQVAMVMGQTWSITFWSYHALMGGATAIAIGAIFLELDRRRGLERFLPPNVVERVIVGDKLSLEGQRRTATILFTDLRGSTSLAERATPEAAVATVNAYLRVMARAVIDEGGILDKFTGDGLMAIFGAMSDATAGARSAARAAVRMRADLASLNAERSGRGEPTVGYGIGIHTGEVVLGAVGLPERSDYTAMGDTVNTAARMESLTKELGVDTIVSGATATLLDGEVRPLGEATVKGKAGPLQVFALA